MAHLRFSLLPSLFLLLLLALPLQAQPTTTVAPTALDTVRAGRFDNGRMWTFEDPPVDYLRQAYGFAPDAAWFEKARLGALRIPGCSASFVSPYGLVMTNHHCARDYGTQVSRPGENILDNGFYAASLAEERKVEGLYADQLVAITDVTDEVDAAVAGAQTDAERAAARQQAIESITARLTREAGGEAAGAFVQVIALYNGGKYSAYTFKRYRDVRLVMIPELQLGFFGGDYDNFTYPRYALDMSYLRVYENDRPLATPNHFAWAAEGVEEDDLVFVIGNPGSTSRLETVAQLAFRRDLREPLVLDFFRRRIAALQAALAEAPAGPVADAIRNEISSLSNAEKLYEGRVKALRDPVIMARRQDTERRLVEALAQPEYAASRGLVERMAEIQAQKLALRDAFSAYVYLNFGFAYESATLQRAVLLYPYLSGAGGVSNIPEGVRRQALALSDQAPGIDQRYLATRLEEIGRYLGPGVLQGVLGGQDAATAARRIVGQSALADSARLAQALSAGTLSLSDPALALAQALWPSFSAYRSAFAALTAQEQEVGRALGRARYDVYGTALPPDATFSLRFTDGVVRGYPYNGTIAPPYTTFYGLYDHYYSYGPGTAWDLPARWLDPPASFDLSTPMNFVSTNDIIGGNSGSPVLNRDLQVVGLVFDGNIESLSSAYLFLTELPRAVSVDVRGMREALDHIYDADRLVLELTTGRLVPTEAEADRVRR